MNLLRTYKHTHTHIYIYIYACIFMYRGRGERERDIHIYIYVYISKERGNKAPRETERGTTSKTTKNRRKMSSIMRRERELGSHTAKPKP